MTRPGSNAALPLLLSFLLAPRPFRAYYAEDPAETARHGHFAILNQDLPRAPIDANVFLLDMRAASRSAPPAPGS